MAKRPNPFNTNSPFQRKTRVGEREVNLGVDREDKMKNVYAKTLRLLKEGASQLAFMENFANQHNIKKDDAGTSAAPADVDPASANGGLENGNGHVFAKELKECCKIFDRDKCSFCENIVCEDCLRICYNCEEIFCDLCSIKQYEADGEYALCLSCPSDE